MRELGLRSLNRRFERELSDLTDTVLAGGPEYDRVTAERMVRVLAAMSQILAQHPVDGMGRCRACRRVTGSLLYTWRPRADCLINDALSLHLAGRNRARL